MPLLRPTTNGNMYPGWWRWNPIGGCEHSCSYCYMRAMSKRTGKDMMTATGLREEYLNDNLGSGRKIFVCSSGDMWGEWVDANAIGDVLSHCREYHDNEYMFLTKNPARYEGWSGNLSTLNCIIGATIETDIVYADTGARDMPDVRSRLERMGEFREKHWSWPTMMISIEPVMKFSKDFYNRIYDAGPDIVYIGRDTGHNNLPEPTDDELRGLVTELRNAGITVHLKKSLSTLLS